MAADADPNMKAYPFLAALLLIALVPLLLAGESFDPEDRESFLAAEEALAKGEHERFESLAQGLKHYPLYPYLLFQRLARNLKSADPKDVRRFLTDHADTPLADRLRRSWLKRLAAQGRWREYVHVYVPDDSMLRRCQYLHGLMQTGRRDEAVDQIEPLWLTGKSLPDACDPVLEEWEQAGRLTTKLVWDRVVLAMEAGDLGLARYLGKSLPGGERLWLDRWLTMHRDPQQVLDADGLTEPHPQRTSILADGIARLAHKMPDQAADAWDRIAAQLPFPADRAQSANAAVGFALAKRGNDRGLSFLDRIPARNDNFDLQERRLRVALKLGYWDGIGSWIQAMPDGQRKAEHWLYWQARAEDMRGNAARAQTLYHAASGERSLWGFLAAERVGSSYKLNGEPTPAVPDRIARIEGSAAYARIGELEILGRDLDLRREWYRLTRDMQDEDLKAAAVIAQRRDWPDRAIITLAKSGYWDDLALRFPLLHRDIVRDQARATGLDEAWIYAILRQESAFNPTAVSHAGATGLMQLMPATARQVASTLGLPRPSRNELSDPGLNITLGSAYLARMQGRYDGSAVLAAAAYNAGPGNADKWLPENQIDADIWVATIPFRETRGYVRRVLAYRVIYDYRLGNPIRPLQGIMRPIGGDGASRE